MTESERVKRFEKIVAAIEQTLLVQARGLRELDELDERAIALLARTQAGICLLDGCARVGHLTERHEQQYSDLYETHAACLRLLDMEINTGRPN